jgi:hypothetical protein
MDDVGLLMGIIVVFAAIFVTSCVSSDVQERSIVRSCDDIKQFTVKDRDRKLVIYSCDKK